MPPSRLTAHRLPPRSLDEIAANQDIHERVLQKAPNITRYISRHSGAPGCGERGRHRPEACFHGSRAPSLSSGPGMTNVQQRGISWVEPPRPLALQTHRGPALQVGAIYRSHDSDRDSSQTVDIGPGV